MEFSPSKRLLKIGWYATAVLFGLIIFGNSIVNINSGYVGVLTTFGRVTGERQPGVSWKIPFVQGFQAMDVQVQKDQVDASAASKDLQSVTTTVALNYHLDHAQVSNVFVNLSADYADRIISPDIQETVKAVTARYNAEELLSNRAQVANDVTNLLTEKLQPRGIMVDQVSIVDFQFSSAFSNAIEAKQVAQQQAQQAQYDLQKAQLQAQANQVQDAALSSQILEQQAIAKWDGKLPTTMTGSSNIFSIPVGQ